MSGMDRLTDEALDGWNKTLEWDDKHSAGDSFDSDELHELLLMARELLAHRRASHAAPARSDGLREALEGTVYVEVSGLTGSGKSGVMGEIEIALRAIGLETEHDENFAAEKRMSHADWQADLELYKPRVVLRERNIRRAALTPAPAQEGGE